MPAAQTLEEYVAECERKIAALEERTQRLERRLEATIAVTTRQATGAVIERLQEALIDGDTFAALVGREGRDVYLFRVSEAWIEAMGDNEWHGPVEWRIAREQGGFVTLEMREVPT